MGPMVVRLFIGLVLALAVCWALLVAVGAVFARRRGVAVRDVAGMVPQLGRLMWSIARDRAVPRSVRWRLWAALAYGGQPFNLIPDFIPVVGYVDNVVVMVWAVRSVIRRVGSDVATRHWRGTPEALTALFDALRLDVPGGAGASSGDSAVRNQ